jgi:phosphoribosylanthranilate isomerase
MITQIYSIQSPEEALACIEAGADRIGVLTEEPGGPYPCGVTTEECRRIFAAIGDRAVKVLISTRKTEEEILAETADLLPDVLHLCAEYRGNPKFREKLRDIAPSVQLMEAIGVMDESAVGDAIYRAGYADLLLLDTIAEDVPGIGAAGKTHDWSIDRRIVESVAVPVILAGGLGPDNVRDAIAAVGPWGVDSLTKTSVKENGILLRKDIDKVREFCRIAHEAEEGMNA